MGKKEIEKKKMWRKKLWFEKEQTQILCSHIGKWKIQSFNGFLHAVCEDCGKLGNY